MAGELHVLDRVRWLETTEISLVTKSQYFHAADAFLGNVKRCIDLIHTPCMAIPNTTDRAVLQLMAIHKVLGRFKISEAEHSEHREAFSEAMKELQPKHKMAYTEGVTPIQYGAKQLEMYAASDEGDYERGIRQIFSAQVIAIWTAFETFAADLWVAALNHDPTLARNASMSQLRVEKNDSAINNDLRKSILISEIHDYDYDLRGCMGSLLKAAGKFKFSRLEGAIGAYRAAFGKRATAIFGKPDYARLTVLEGIRNVLVHNAGKIDARFKERVKENHSAYGQLGSIPVGDDLPIDGNIVREFMALCVSIARELIALINQGLDRKQGLNDLSNRSDPGAPLPP